MQLRDYQREALNAIFAYLSTRPGNPLALLPTGSGKGPLIAATIRAVLHYFLSRRVLVLTHDKRLIEQNYEKLMAMMPDAPAGIWSASLKRRDKFHQVIFGGIGTVYKHAATLGHIDLVLVDEAHLIGDDDAARYLTLYRALLAINPALRMVGFSATGYRMGMGPLTEGGIFTAVCYDITHEQGFTRLLAGGYLAPLVVQPSDYALPLDGVRVSGGEFNAASLAEHIDRDEITRAALRDTVARAEGRNHWLIFAAGVHHCERIVAILAELGVSAVAVHSKMPDAQQDENVSLFKAGKVTAAVNNNVLTTGFDFPAIDLIVMLRPTRSTALHVQMLGRGTRPFPSKSNCLVLDYARNCERLGPIDAPRLPRSKKLRDIATDPGDNMPPVKRCPVESCGVYNKPRAVTCEHCGAPFPPPRVGIQDQASNAQAMATAVPKIERFRVVSVSYEAHPGRGDKPPLLKVSYRCAPSGVFRQWVCVEHTNLARKKAEQWWQERVRYGECPRSVGLALAIISGRMKSSVPIKEPTHLEVWTNKQPYPEIVSYEL